MPSLLTFRIREVNPSKADFCNNAVSIGRFPRQYWPFLAKRRPPQHAMLTSLQISYRLYALEALPLYVAEFDQLSQDDQEFLAANY